MRRFRLLAMVGIWGLGTGAAVEVGEAQEKPSAVNHDLAGKESCLVCHAMGASPVLDVPEDHQVRDNETCMWCHAPDSPMLTADPSRTPHTGPVADMDCLQCHGLQAPPAVGAIPEDHVDRGNHTCTWCHPRVEG